MYDIMESLPVGLSGISGVFVSLKLPTSASKKHDKS